MNDTIKSEAKFPCQVAMLKSFKHHNSEVHSTKIINGEKVAVKKSNEVCRVTCGLINQEFVSEYPIEEKSNLSDVLERAKKDCMKRLCANCPYGK